jgi:hypothetical protein
MISLQSIKRKHITGGTSLSKIVLIYVFRVEFCEHSRDGIVERCCPRRDSITKALLNTKEYALFYGNEILGVTGEDMSHGRERAVRTMCLG